MKVLINERLSQHKFKTPEGYLICQDAILARTGKQTYRRNEVFSDSEDDGEIEIDRKYEEVFSPKTLASFENKPITVEHPDEDVNINNYKDYAVGFVRDVKQGKTEDGEDVILGTLVITDAQTIEEIEAGEHTDLSCGYDCDIIDEENPQQRNIRGNHVALCQQGRAGIARIVDSVKDSQIKIEKRLAPDKSQLESDCADYNCKIVKQDSKYYYITGSSDDLQELKDNYSEVEDSIKDSVDNTISYVIVEYDKGTKLWTVLAKNKVGDTLNNPQYAGSKQEAMSIAKEYKEGEKCVEIYDSIKDVKPDDIQFLIDDEYEAIEGYQKKLEIARKENDEPAIAKFQHIIDDEMEHIQELKDLLENDKSLYDSKVKDGNEIRNFDAYELRDRFGRDYDEKIKSIFPNVNVIDFAYFGNVKLIGSKSDLDKIEKMIKFEDSVHDSVKDSNRIKEIEKKLNELYDEWDWADDHNNHWEANNIMNQIEGLQKELQSIKSKTNMTIEDFDPEYAIRKIPYAKEQKLPYEFEVFDLEHNKTYSRHKTFEEAKAALKKIRKETGFTFRTAYKTKDSNYKLQYTRDADGITYVSLVKAIKQKKEIKK